jgi:HEAT repeat protein
MKYLAIFLGAVLGGLAGAGAMYFATRPQHVRFQAEEARVLRAELLDLRDRIERLEAQGSSTSPIRGADVTAPAITREELLEAARNAARDVATEIARLESADADAALERDTALARAIDQVRAPHSDTRRNGIRRLRRMFASEASSEVVAALADESVLVRMEAATYFEYLWDPAALEPLARLMYGEDESIAEQALDALCKSGEEEAIAKLHDYYMNGPALELALEAGKALEENRRTAALPEGARRFRDALSSAEPDQRRLGLAGVGRWGNVATDESRVRALTADADERVRAEAQKTLVAWGLEGGK